MGSQRLWRRLRNWWRAVPAGTPVRPDAEAGGTAPGGGVPAESAPVRPLWKRDDALRRLQQDYERVIDLVGAIERHLGAQEERSERLCRAVEQLVAIAQQQAQTARAQGEQLERIAENVGAGRARVEDVAAAVDSWRTLAREHSGHLEEIGRRIGAAAEEQREATRSLRQVERGVDALAATAAHQRDALHGVREVLVEQQVRLERHLRRQQWWLAGVLSVVGVALIVAVVALMQAGGGEVR